MVKNLICCQSFCRIYFKHFLQKVHSLRIDITVYLTVQIESHIFVVVVDFFKFLSTEKRSGHQQNMKDNTCRKNITRVRYFLSFFKFYHFRSHIARSPASVKDVIFSVTKSSQAEVGQNWLKVIFEHYIFRFDISMHNILRMTMFKSFHKPGHYSFYFDQAKVTLSFVYFIVQVTMI